MLLPPGCDGAKRRVTFELRDAETPQIEKVFPGLASSGYRITSPAEARYNCLAWAVGSDQTWLQAERVNGYYWPPGVTRENSVSSWIDVMRMHGFESCDDSEQEPGWEKVAIYVDASGEPGHIARQCAEG